ncbi:MAG: GNAT family N-acetyltransferase [Acidobacteriota bacterium]
MPADAHSTERREIIRPSTSEDARALSDLFRDAFGAERDEAIWRWKLFENPRGAASYVCEAEGRLVAHCAGLPVRFADYGKEYQALQSVDFMSSPGYPGGIGRGGVFVRTAHAFFKAHCGPTAIPLVYGFPGERHRLLGEKLLGYRSIERVGELVLAPAGHDGESQELLPEHLKLIGQLPIEFGAIRDEVYLRWRYLEHPLYRYRLVQARRPFHVHPRIGAIVREGEEALYVMEIGGSFSRPSLSALVQVLARFGKPAIFWCSPLHPIARILQSCGFEARQRDHSVECRFFTQHELPRPGELYYTLGDYDVQ